MWGLVESWPENESIENYWGQANSFAIRKRKNFAKQYTASAFPYMAKRSPYVSLRFTRGLCASCNNIVLLLPTFRLNSFKT